MTGTAAATPTPTAAARRLATLAELAARPFDLLVIGGGATGAATARDAALRGLAVGLVDAGDFAGETSSRSSKLIHGGLRCLRYGNLPSSSRAVRTRRLMRIRHLCRPIEVLVSRLRGESPGLATLGLGVALYSPGPLARAGPTRRVDANELYRLSPHLRSAGPPPAPAARRLPDRRRRAWSSRTSATPRRPARPSPTACRPKRWSAIGGACAALPSSTRRDRRAPHGAGQAGRGGGRSFTDSLLAGSAAPPAPHPRRTSSSTPPGCPTGPRAGAAHQGTTGCSSSPCPPATNDRRTTDTDLVAPRGSGPPTEGWATRCGRAATT
jgi:hypothetical protein